MLFLCSANTCRSQMAEGFLRRIAGERFEVCSAGLEPGAAIDPLAVQVMAEVGIDIRAQRPKNLREYLGKRAIHWLIILCEASNNDCPHVWPLLQDNNRLFWPFPDPALQTDSSGLRLRVFRDVRDSIRAKLELWLATL